MSRSGGLLGGNRLTMIIIGLFQFCVSFEIQFGNMSLYFDNLYLSFFLESQPFYSDSLIYLATSEKRSSHGVF